jgi:hypothetical protein
VLQEFEKLKRLNFSQLNKALVHVVVVVGVSEIYGLPCGPSSVARAAPGQLYAAVCPFSVWLHIGWTPGVGRDSNSMLFPVVVGEHESSHQASRSKSFIRRLRNAP